MASFPARRLGEAGTLYHMSISYDMGTRDVVDFISMRPEGPVAYKYNILSACHNDFFFHCSVFSTISSAIT